MICCCVIGVRSGKGHVCVCVLGLAATLTTCHDNERSSRNPMCESIIPGQLFILLSRLCMDTGTNVFRSRRCPLLP